MSIKVITGKVRASFVHVFKPQSINGSEPKYSCSLIIPKSDTVTVGKIREAIEQAKQEGVPKWGGKIPPNLKLPLRDGDVDRPEDPAYADSYFMSRAELRLTDGAIVSAVTGSETYRQERQKLREDLEALIRDRENWHIADRPPETPAADTLWLVTSVTPHLLKRWDGAEWVSCGAETDLSQYYTKTEMDTRLEQTDSGIAALASRVATTADDTAALAARLEQAELKITPEAITSAVRETGLYQYGAYEGHNYLRSSGDTLTFTNGNLVENGEETSRRYVTLPFSQDLFAHSGNASSLYLSFDIRRTDVALGGNNSVRAYAGF